MDEWEPIPSQRVRTILIVDVGDVRSYEKELRTPANGLDPRKSLPLIPREEFSLNKELDVVSSY